MSEAEPAGCLMAVLKLLGFNAGGRAEGSDEGIAEGSDELPYRLRDDFLSPAELAFYRVLVQAVEDQAVICPKVNLADLFFVARPGENHGFRSKINRKHVDFVLCRPDTMKPVCGIELDDSSHARPDRVARDDFVDQVFQVAGLPLERVPAKAAYNRQALRATLEPHWNNVAVARPAPPPSSESGPPLCPKCGVPMVSRTAGRGPNAGRTFFGCPNYPRCRETV